jgi:site-specific recombinase XerC
VAGLLKFAVREGVIPSSPAMHVSQPVVRQKAPRFLTIPEVAMILRPIDRRETIGARDFAIISTLAFAGLRLGEIVNLNLRDVRLDVGTIRASGKGGKVRVLPLHAAAASAIREWIEVRPPYDSDAMFLSRFAKRIAIRTVENVCKVRGAAGGFPDLHPCMLRHTFATALYGNGVDLLEIQALLGHSSIMSTAIYTHTDPARLAGAVATIRP